MQTVQRKFCGFGHAQLALVGLIVTSFIVSAGSGCARQRAKREAKKRVSAPPQKDPFLVAAEQKIAIDKMPTDLAVQARVNNMPFAELSARLGAVSFVGQYKLTMQRDEISKTQSLKSSIEQDAKGQFHVEVEIEGGDLQHIIYADNLLYLRHNYGHWRASRDPTDERLRWREQAYRLWPSFFKLFEKQLSFSQGRPVQFLGRPALRFEMSVKAQKELPAPMPQALLEPQPATPDLRHWHAQAQRIETWRSYAVCDAGGGSIIVDSALGTPLQVEFSGQMRVEDQVDHPAKMQVELHAELKKIAHVEPITPPKDFVEEFSRRKIITDPLSFLGPDAPVQAPAKPDPKDQARGASAQP